MTTDEIFPALALLLIAFLLYELGTPKEAETDEQQRPENDRYENHLETPEMTKRVTKGIKRNSGEAV